MTGNIWQKNQNQVKRGSVNLSHIKKNSLPKVVRWTETCYFLLVRNESTFFFQKKGILVQLDELEKLHKVTPA